MTANFSPSSIGCRGRANELSGECVTDRNHRVRGRNSGPSPQVLSNRVDVENPSRGFVTGGQFGVRTEADVANMTWMQVPKTVTDSAVDMMLSPRPEDTVTTWYLSIRIADRPFRWMIITIQAHIPDSGNKCRRDFLLKLDCVLRSRVNPSNIDTVEINKWTENGVGKVAETSQYTCLWTYYVDTVLSKYTGESAFQCAW